MEMAKMEWNYFVSLFSYREFKDKFTKNRKTVMIYSHLRHPNLYLFDAQFTRIFMQLFSAKQNDKNDKKDNKYAIKLVQMMYMLFLYCCWIRNSILAYYSYYFCHSKNIVIVVRVV